MYKFYSYYTAGSTSISTYKITDEWHLNKKFENAEYVDIALYLADVDASGKAHSRPGVTPKGGMTAEAMRAAANKNTSNEYSYGVLDY